MGDKPLPFTVTARDSGVTALLRRLCRAFPRPSKRPVTTGLAPMLSSYHTDVNPRLRTHCGACGSAEGHAAGCSWLDRKHWGRS